MLYTNDYIHLYYQHFKGHRPIIFSNICSLIGEVKLLISVNYNFFIDLDIFCEHALHGFKIETLFTYHL